MMPRQKLGENRMYVTSSSVASDANDERPDRADDVLEFDARYPAGDVEVIPTGGVTIPMARFITMTNAEHQGS
jgi:hypothetical protein